MSSRHLSTYTSFMARAPWPNSDPPLGYAGCACRSDGPGKATGGGGLGDGVDPRQGVAAGSTVTEEHLFRMLGMLQDPITGEQLGRPPRATGPTSIDRFGRAGKPAAPVAGFDLTFSAPKSVSVAWAVGDPATQAAIYRAHVAALEYVIGYGERAVFSSRSGDGGVVQEDIRGVVAAGFDHWDSRAGDPQLHTHVVVMNRVQCGDGVWRTLDGRVLFRATVALSEMYNAVLSDSLRPLTLRRSTVAQRTSTASTCYDACSPLRASRSRPPRRSRTSGPTPTQPARSPPSTSPSRGPSSMAAAPPSTTPT